VSLEDAMKLLKSARTELEDVDLQCDAPLPEADDIVDVLLASGAHARASLHLFPLTILLLALSMLV